MTRRYRIYFNRIEDAPQIWSIDMGSHQSEVNVRGVQLLGVSAMSRSDLDAQDPEPKAWLECDAALMISENGEAVFT